MVRFCIHDDCVNNAGCANKPGSHYPGSTVKRLLEMAEQEVERDDHKHNHKLSMSAYFNYFIILIFHSILDHHHKGLKMAPTHKVQHKIQMDRITNKVNNNHSLRLCRGNRLLCALICEEIRSLKCGFRMDT